MPATRSAEWIVKALLAAGICVAFCAHIADAHTQAVSAVATVRIDEGMFISIGGIDQWVSIKGDDRNNPVVLFLHGGPGDAYSPFADAMFAGWQKDFTLVQWDQRGAGRTYGKSGPSIEPTMTVERMAQDGIEVAEFVVRHLDKKKIIIVGGSWGSILGIHMARARPDLFTAYVGFAQVVSPRKNLLASYARVFAMARASDDQQAIAALTKIGPPPWDALAKWPVFHKLERVYQAKIVTASPAPLALGQEYASPQEQAQYEAAEEFSFEHFWGARMSGPLWDVDLSSLSTDFAIPIFMVQGGEDLTAPPELARAYFDSIKAPTKQFYLAIGTGHEPSIAELDQVHNVLMTQVRSAPPHATH